MGSKEPVIRKGRIPCENPKPVIESIPISKPEYKPILNPIPA